jgi:hypothetical protein
MSTSLTLQFSRRTLAIGIAAAAGLLALGDRAKAHRHTESTPEASPMATPAAGPSLLLRMESSGGLMPMEYVAVQMPEFSLYDDGSLYRLGPTIAIYPPAALPNLTRMRLSQAGIDAIVEQAKAAGLEHSQSVANTMVMDAPTTVFTYNDHGTMVKTTAGALISDAPIPPDWDEQDTTTYNNLLNLRAFLSGIDGSLPEGSVLEPDVPIDPERLQIVSFVPDPAQPLASNVPDPEQPPVEWPLSTPLADLGAPYLKMSGEAIPPMNCAELSGDDLEKVVAASRTGNFTSPWTDDGVTYGLLMRPLLPDEVSCQSMGMGCGG